MLLPEAGLQSSLSLCWGEVVLTNHHRGILPWKWAWSTDTVSGLLKELSDLDISLMQCWMGDDYKLWMGLLCKWGALCSPRQQGRAGMRWDEMSGALTLGTILKEEPAVQCSRQIIRWHVWKSKSNAKIHDEQNVKILSKTTFLSFSCVLEHKTVPWKNKPSFPLPHITVCVYLNL